MSESCRIKIIHICGKSIQEKMNKVESRSFSNRDNLIYKKNENHRLGFIQSVNETGDKNSTRPLVIRSEI